MENNQALYEYITNLRREKFVDAMQIALNDNNLVGYLGRKVPLEILYAFNLVVVAVDGVDQAILDESDEVNLCSIIDSTITYAKTEKCPYLFFSKLIIVDDSCPLLVKKLKEVLKDKVYVYQDDELLKKKLLEVYNCNFNQDLYNNALKFIKLIDDELLKLSKSNIDSKFLYEINFYSNFIFDLKERYQLIKKLTNKYPDINNQRTKLYVPRAIQIIDEIDKKYSNYEIIEGCKCLGRHNFDNHKMDIEYDNCCLKEKE